MLGAIIGDVAGSKYEFHNLKSKDFIFFDEDCRVTDDSVMTLAVCNALLKCKGDYGNLEKAVVKEMQAFGKKYPSVGYGHLFKEWIKSDNPQAYNSFGNGSAMRIGAVPYFASSLDECKKLSEIVTKVTHNHPEGLKGAEATAVCIYMALHGCNKAKIKEVIERDYYKLDFDYSSLVKEYKFDGSCQGTVPQAIYCFLISSDFEDAIRTGISIGGDSDTIGAIVGSIAEAYYGVPHWIKDSVKKYLDKNLLSVYKRFEKEKLSLDKLEKEL